MSYEATYRSEMDTRLARYSICDVSKGIMTISNSVRKTCDEGLKLMNSYMNNSVVTNYTVEKHFMNTQNNCNTKIQNYDIVKNQSNGSTSLTVKSVISDLTISQKNARLTKNNVDEVNQELIEKTFVDVKTVLTIQAMTTCGWTIIKSNSETTSQTLIAQNNEGTVLAVNIQPDKMMMDTSGLCDSSCKKHVQDVIKELNKLGIKFNLENENEHRKKGGGTLLSFGTSASLVHKAAKIKGSLKKNLSFQTSVSNGAKDSTKNYQQEKKRERN